IRSRNSPAATGSGATRGGRGEPASRRAVGGGDLALPRRDHRAALGRGGGRGEDATRGRGGTLAATTRLTRRREPAEAARATRRADGVALAGCLILGGDAWGGGPGWRRALLPPVRALATGGGRRSRRWLSGPARRCPPPPYG